MYKIFISFSCLLVLILQIIIYRNQLNCNIKIDYITEYQFKTLNKISLDEVEIDKNYEKIIKLIKNNRR